MVCVINNNLNLLDSKRFTVFDYQSIHIKLQTFWRLRLELTFSPQNLNKIRLTKSFYSIFRPDYAADSSSEESEDEFEFQQKKKAPKDEPVEEQEQEPEVKDRRLRRLQDRETTQDSDDEDRYGQMINNFASPYYKYIFI